MAILKIYNDIQTEAQKAEAQLWGEIGGVCFKDIDAFCENIPQDDAAIDLRIHCDGGSVLEGWAIYDRLRATGKTITATIEGNAASMATIILMAAPKERRYAHESARICVHNPWISPYGLSEAVDADELQRISEELRDEQQKMVNLYVDRCGCSAVEIQQLMDKDKYIDAEEAKKYGLIGAIIPHASASKKKAALYTACENNQKINKMGKRKVEVEQSFVDKVLRFFGKKSITEISFGMDLNTADGDVLTIEREEGEPQVGDAAYPDGEFIMPDGSTIVVKEGLITSITTSDGEANGSADDTSEAGEESERIKELEEEVEKLKEELEGAKRNARSAKDLRILNAVKMAGGEKVLANIKSSYRPSQRQPSGKQAQKQAQGTMTSSISEKLKQRRNKK